MTKQTECLRERSFLQIKTGTRISLGKRIFIRFMKGRLCSKPMQVRMKKRREIGKRIAKRVKEKKLMDMTKGAENPNKQKHEKSPNKLSYITIC